MASRNQAAIGSDEKLILLVGGLIVGVLLLLGLVFGIANGVASGFAGFLHDAGLPRDMAVDVYRTVRWAVVGLLLLGFGIVVSKILS